VWCIFYHFDLAIKWVFVLTVLSKTILLFYEPEIMMQDWRFSQRYWWRFRYSGIWCSIDWKAVTGISGYAAALIFNSLNQYSNTFHGPVSAYVHWFSNVPLLQGHADTWALWSNHWCGIYLWWSKLKVCSQIVNISAHFLRAVLIFLNFTHLLLGK
jgi:ABC-type amino acid transport system permease subunit